MSLVDLFSALADPTRCRVVEMLHERSRPVHELAAAFDISRPAISRHLKVLKDAGLVVEEKTGRENVYSLQRAQLQPMQDWLEKHRTARASKKAGKAKSIVDAVVVAPEPAVASAAPEAVAPAPVVDLPITIAAIDADKPKRRPQLPREVIPPPPVPAPQLSFFDL
jgi:DNA-binding transcriptional ArsR family regulator